MYTNIWLDLLLLLDTDYNKALIMLNLPCLKHRKAAKCWAVRYQVLLKVEHTKDLIKQELQFCTECNVHHKRHYYLWYYRYRLIQQAKSLEWQDVVEAERDEINQYIEIHGDASAISYINSI